MTMPTPEELAARCAQMGISANVLAAWQGHSARLAGRPRGDLPRYDVDTTPAQASQAASGPPASPEVTRQAETDAALYEALYGRPTP